MRRTLILAWGAVLALLNAPLASATFTDGYSVGALLVSPSSHIDSVLSAPISFHFTGVVLIYDCAANIPPCGDAAHPERVIAHDFIIDDFGGPPGQPIFRYCSSYNNLPPAVPTDCAPATSFDIHFDSVRSVVGPAGCTSALCEMTTLFTESGFDTHGQVGPLFLRGEWHGLNNVFVLDVFSVSEPSGALLLGLAGAASFASTLRRKRLMAPIRSSVGIERSLG